MHMHGEQKDFRYLCVPVMLMLTDNARLTALFERDANVGKHRENSESPSESLLPTPTKKRFTKADGSKVAKLAILAANAVKNVDLHRALELIEQIRAVGEGGDASEGEWSIWRGR